MGGPVFRRAQRFGRVAKDCRLPKTLEGPGAQGGPVYRCAPKIRPSRGMTAVSQNPRGVRRPGGAGRFVRIAHLGFGRVANDYRSPKTLEGPALKGARFSAQQDLVAVTKDAVSSKKLREASGSLLCLWGNPGKCCQNFVRTLIRPSRE